MSEVQNYLILGATSDLAKAFVMNSDSKIAMTLVARDKKKLGSIYGDDFHHLECDLTDEADVKSMVSELKQSKTKFDGILCAVGSHEVMPLRLYEAEKFMQILNSNFFSVANVLRNVSSILNSGASIVLLSSAVTSRGAATVSAYVAAKSAVEGLTKAAALEFSKKKVRVNAIAPGVFKSKMSDKFLSSMNAEQQEQIIASHPLGVGTTEQVASVIHFLLSESASWITGQTIIVDGGYSINA